MTTLPSPRRSFRPILALGGFVYLAWWFATEWLLPGSFNPLAGRLMVVAYFAVAYALGFVWDAARRHSETLYYVGAVLLVGHYFYLFQHNARDINWTVGTYVVVFALAVSIDSRRWLYALTSFSLACGALVWALEPSLQRTIFLPGLATILALCLVVMLARVRLLERLAESTDRFQSLFDAAFEGIAVHDHGTIIDANASFASMFGYTRSELIGCAVDMLAAPEQREATMTRMRELPSGRYQTVGVRKDGSTFAIEISAKPHIYRGQRLRLAAVRDVSERERAERERLALLQEQTERASAQEALRMRDEFISIASHELRTPLTSLLLNLELFVPRWQAGHADIETYATRVRRQLARMRRLVDELLDVTRLDAGQLKLAPESLDLTLVAQELTDGLRDDLERAGCTLRIQSAGSLRGSWDRLRLEQMLENLLRNALTYGAGYPLELILYGEAPSSVTLSVRDHGPGIDPAIHERIFLRYERGVSARNYGGLGLGLYISKQIVDLHQGTIRVDSQPGAGATFTIELPRGQLETQPAKPAQPLL